MGFASRLFEARYDNAVKAARHVRGNVRLLLLDAICGGGRKRATVSTLGLGTVSVVGAGAVD